MDTIIISVSQLLLIEKKTRKFSRARKKGKLSEIVDKSTFKWYQSDQEHPADLFNYFLTNLDLK